MAKYTTHNDSENNMLIHIFDNGYIVKTHLKAMIAYKELNGKFDNFLIGDLSLSEYFNILNKIGEEVVK